LVSDDNVPLIRYFGRLAQRESTALTTQSGRSRDQGRFAKYLVSAYLVTAGDIQRHAVTGV
jgi:hypothetical protein